MDRRDHLGRQPVNIRRGRQQDVDRIMQLRSDAAHWLASIGSDQWSEVSIDDTEFRRRVEQSTANGETWVAVDEHGNLLGTIAVDEYTNPGLWTDREMADALVIHRMIRARNAPPGTGHYLLEHAIELARRAGKKWLRLDAWTTNEWLHRYYESQGFQHVRTINQHHTRSAALFELPISREVIMQSTVRKPLVHAGDTKRDNPSAPDHWHRVDGLTVYAPYAFPKQGPLDVPADSRLLHLWHDGTRWLVSTSPPSSPYNSWARHVMSWDEALELQTDRHYVIEHRETEHGCQLALREPDTPQEGGTIDHHSGQDRP